MLGEEVIEAPQMNARRIRLSRHIDLRRSAP